MKLHETLDGRNAIALGNGLYLPTRHAWAMLGLLIACAVLGMLACIPPSPQGGLQGFAEGIRLLFGNEFSGEQRHTLLELRLPRLLVAWLAGWCVAIPGALLQGITRNPLADPGLLGLSQGAITVVMLLLIFLPQAPRWLVVAAALGGGLMVALLLAWLVGRSHAGGLATLLMGISLESVLSSVTAILLLYLPGDLSVSLSEWMAGSLFRADWDMVGFFLPAALLGVCGIVLLGPGLRVLALGQEMGMALGENVRRTRPLVLLLAVLMNTVSVVAVGPLSLLGVLAPWLAQRIASATGRPHLLLSGLMGGLLVMLADRVSQQVLDDSPIPIGMALTLIGVPSFIVAMRLHALHRRHA